jgi:activator of Hsp90 ATPase-like protein
MSATITPAPVRRTIRVKAAPARAFDVFTTRIGSWWPHEHSINKSSPQKEVVVEPHVGGRWFERGEDQSECQWGRVLVWEPPARVVLAWQINAQWQYDPDIETEVEVRFIPDGAGTRVEFEHRNLERFGDKVDAVRTAIDAPEGWSRLLALFAQAADA